MLVGNEKNIDRTRRWMEDWRNDEELLKAGQRFAPMSFMDLVALQVKFSHLKEIIESRHKIKALYENELGGIAGFKIFKDGPEVTGVAQNFVLCCQSREGLADFLADQGIMVQKPYRPLHQMKVFKGLKKENFPVSEEYFLTALHLPLHSFMSLEKARSVIGACRSFVVKKGCS